MTQKPPTVAPPSIVDFANIEAGATNPVRVKFMTGFNQGVRNARLKQPELSGIHRASRSEPFLKGYEAGRIAYRAFSPETTNEVTARLDEAWRFYASNNHGTDLAWDTKLVA